MKKSTILFLLFFALACTFLGFGIGRRIYNRPPVETKDTIFTTGLVYIPDPELIDIYIPEPSVPVDTTAIIEDYLKARVYNDTLISNSEITAVLRDTIYQNSILGRTFFYSLSTPVIKGPQRPFSLFLTADTRFSTSLVITRNKWLIQGGYDFRYKYPFLAVGFKLY